MPRGIKNTPLKEITIVSNRARLALLDIHVRCSLAVDDNGVKIGAIPYLEFKDAIDAAYGERSDKQARALLTRWRGEDPRRPGRLLPDPPSWAWIEQVEGPKAKYFRVTDYALGLIGEATAAAFRRRAFDYVDARTHRNRENKQKRESNRIGIKAVRKLARTHPDGFDLDQLFVALTQAGSKTIRERVRVYAKLLLDRGLTIRLSRGSYKVNVEHHALAPPKKLAGPRTTYSQRKKREQERDAREQEGESND